MYSFCPEIVNGETLPVGECLNPKSALPILGDKFRHLQSLASLPALKYDAYCGSLTAKAVRDCHNLSSKIGITDFGFRHSPLGSVSSFSSLSYIYILKEDTDIA